jgi:hypothetical protein
MRRTLALLVLALAAACGSDSPATLSAPTPTPMASPSPSPDPIPSFTTPEAAMTYLADAYNRHDLVALKHVTTQSARDALESMRVEAVDLRLDHCEYDKAGKDYGCSFTHDFPAGYDGRHGTGYDQADRAGTALFTVGPARRSGWYMTVLEECG